MGVHTNVAVATNYRRRTMNKISILWKNWTFHNLVAHPLMEIVFLLSLGKAKRLSTWIHDSTIPKHNPLLEDIRG